MLQLSELQVGMFVNEVLYLLSSCLQPNTSGNGRMDNASSEKGSWGTSVALHRCNACYFGLSV